MRNGSGLKSMLFIPGIGGLLAAGCPSNESGGAAVAPLADAALQGGSPPPSSQAASAPQGALDSEESGGKPFSGLVKLADDVSAESVKPTDVLFVMARESQGGGHVGRLVAVQRFGRVEFPFRYEMSRQNLMVPGFPFQGPFIVTVRLDRDGDPMTRGQDDLYGSYPGEVSSGQEGVHITLTKGMPKEVQTPPRNHAPPAPAPVDRGSASPPPMPPKR